MRARIKSCHLRKRTNLAGWMLHNWNFFAILTVACLAVAEVQAQPTTTPFVDMKYELEPTIKGCPTMLEFRSIVARELGYDPYLSGASMGLSVRVRSSETGIEASVDWNVEADRKVGERRFAARAEECRAMLTTVAFVAAVQIQLMGKAESAEPGPQQTHKIAAPSMAALSNSDSVPRDHNERRPIALSMRSLELRLPSVSNGSNGSNGSAFTLSVGAGPAVGVGIAPNAIGLGRLFTAIRHGWAGLELGAEVSLPSTARQAYGGGFRHQLMLGTIAGCVWQGPLAACALGKLGRIRAQGVGVDVPLSPNGLLAEAGPRIGYALWQNQRLALLAHLDGLCSLTSWTVYLNHVAVWRTPRFAAVAGIDLAVQFR